MARTPLTPADVAARVARMPGWELRGDRIARRFRFPDFATAFDWMARVAAVAEQLDHHPEWRNVYDRVDVELTTHSAGGLTRLDFELAEAMEALAAEED